MTEGRSSVSKASSYEAMGEYWDEHDQADAFDPERRVEIEVDIQSEKRYYSIDSHLSRKIEEIARQRGIGGETLLNLWVLEKVGQVKEASL